MSVRLLTPSDYRRMAWKNGGGETIEIALSPESGGLDAFDWRLSMAIVSQDGPFSVFPGIDRHLSVLTGAGIDLGFADGKKVTLTPETPPFFFSGDVPANGRLLDGPVVDLNLMLRRGTAQAQVHRIVDALAAPYVCPPGLQLVYAETESELIVDGTRFLIAPGNTMVAETRQTLVVTAARAHLIFLQK